jgi:hypothetical protein
MADKPPKLEVVTDEQRDKDEAEFRKLRRDLPGVKGASAIGIVAIGVGKVPGKMSSSARIRNSGPSFLWSTSKWAWRSSSSRSTMGAGARWHRHHGQ